MVNGNIVLIAYAHSGFQAAVVINRHEWDNKKQVMIQTCQPGDACLTIDSVSHSGATDAENKAGNLSQWIPAM